MNDTTKNLLLFHYCKGPGWKDFFNLFKNDPDLTLLPKITPSQFSYFTGRSELQSTSILQQLHSLSFEHILSSLARFNTHFIPIYDERYPDSLKTLPQPPWALFARGNLTLLKGEKLAIVGSRQGTQYGKEALKLLIPPLVEKNITVVSGLAKGIDAFAHEQTLHSNGKTIAVTAGGFNHFYPRENVGLAQQIIKHGLLVSEYAPTTKPEKWQFPARNRIVSGLSKGVLVVQAAKKSGSLITASYALEQGIDVFAVPGPITNPLSEGVHELIGDGAKIVHTAADIYTEFD
ncbi:DNA-processing protein DprA [Domibacillus mangrovi]|uniref:DNA protecting protein DprA n=1 Tax=Domibacillus mangrovi TaxID=1714354 RepID=A0A1Q5P4S8_9BACI|nr:DNA-processing protein DprA [Domibacillus mangrovi]OKL37151.1 DNA protecting protein DprA [Domibacillus mangrovi]